MPHLCFLWYDAHASNLEEGVHSWFYPTMACFDCALFNLSPFFSAGQLPQVLLAPPTDKDSALMVKIQTGSFPMGVSEGAWGGGRDEYLYYDVLVDT